MKKLPALLLLKLFLLLLSGSFTSQVVYAQSFDRSIALIGRLRTQKKYAELLVKIEKLQPSVELADIKLFLQAEALQNLKRKDEALAVYTKLIKGYPENETAFQARFPHFLLSLDSATEADVARLEGLALGLPSVWQRGTAFAKLADLEFLKTGRRSRMALHAIRAFNAEKPFYRNATACHDLLKKILNNPADWAFEDDEWIEMLLVAANESLISEFFKSPPPLNILGRYGGGTVEMFRAEHLRQSKQQGQALQVFNDLINSSRLPQPMHNLAIQLRGDLHYHAKSYGLAINDYRKVLQNPVKPVDVIAAQYRLMRSAKEIGRDVESLDMISRLVENAEAVGSLLPVHIFEMGLDYFDKGKLANSVPYFMALARHYPGHYRAHAGLGLAVIALGPNSSEGQTLLGLLKRKYTNSFYIYWIDPSARNTPLQMTEPKIPTLPSIYAKRVKAWKKLWDTDLASFAYEETRKLTDKYPLDKALYHTIIQIAHEAKDYNRLTAYGDRFARQLLESDRSLNEMPSWAWRAMYPLAHLEIVEKYAREFNVDKYWILSIMREESHFRADTLSRSNAHSLMQILPSTGKWIAGRIGVRGYRQSHLWDLDTNIRFGTWYLRFLQDLFNDDLFLASAAYNGGQGNVQRRVEAGPHSSLPVLERLDKIPLPETRDYYKKVMGTHWGYVRLYQK